MKTTFKCFIYCWFWISLISSFRSWDSAWRSLNLACVTCKQVNTYWRVSLLTMTILSLTMFVSIFRNSNNSRLCSIWRNERHFLMQVDDKQLLLATFSLELSHLILFTWTHLLVVHARLNSWTCSLKLHTHLNFLAWICSLELCLQQAEGVG